MGRYIIKNCPAYDCSIVEWNCLGSDTTECKNGNCVLKQIVQVCNEYSNKWEDCDYSNGLANDIFKLLDIQEAE